MQELALKPAGPGAAAVAQVPHDRQVKVGEVRPQLVGAAGERVQRQEGVAVSATERLVLGHRVAATGDHCHPLPLRSPPSSPEVAR